MTLYIYRVIREHLDGTRGKRAKQYCCYEPELHIGGLYVHLGTGYPGLSAGIKYEHEGISRLKKGVLKE